MLKYINATLFRLGSCVILSGVFINTVYAAETIPVKIHLSNGKTKYVQVLGVKLSTANQKALSSNISLMMRQPYRFSALDKSLPEKADLGMGNLPVLDQGMWGSCVTFAVTEAIDALFSLQGEQTISQLCNLELGRTIKNPDEDGGWSGSFGKHVLSQINRYGYLTKEFQHSTGCGGLQHYPAYNPYDNGQPMPEDIFVSNSNKSFTSTHWRTILAFNGTFKPIDPAHGDKTLHDVKTAILRGNRVVFGTLLDPYRGEVGAVGKYDEVNNDTWTLTTEIQKDIESGFIGGHEMVIEGFDDNACAQYQETSPTGTTESRQQCGILHLRNSWSSDAGDRGDFFVTYDYFKTMTLEAYEIVKQ